MLVGGLEHFLFLHIMGRIIPTDVHIFQRGRYTINQYFFLLVSKIQPLTSSSKEETCGQVELWQLRLRWSFHPSPSANEGNSRWMMGKSNRNVLKKLGRFVVHSSIELVIKLLWVDDSFRCRCFQDEIGDAEKGGLLQPRAFS